jgi:hypothetical protein
VSEPCLGKWTPPLHHVHACFLTGWQIPPPPQAIGTKLGIASPTLGDVAAAAGCHVSLAATSLARRAPVYLSSSSHPDMLVRDALRGETGRGGGGSRGKWGRGKGRGAVRSVLLCGMIDVAVLVVSLWILSTSAAAATQTCWCATHSEVRGSEGEREGGVQRGACCVRCLTWLS